MSKVFAFSLLILAILGAVGFFVWQERAVSFLEFKNPAPAQQNVSDSSSQLPREQEEQMRVSSDIPTQIPGVSFEINSLLAADLYKAWHESANIFIDEALKEAKVLYTPEELAGRNPLVEVSVHHTLKRADDKIVSILLDVYYSSVTLAHPYSEYIAFNYSVEEKRRLETSELFIESSDYLSFLSSTVREKLDQKWNEFPIPFDEGTAPREGNFSLIVLVKGGIEVHFDEYQIAPRVSGLPEPVFIPNSMLEGKLKKQYAD